MRAWGVRFVDELDYRRELANLQRFAALYGRGGTAARTLRRRGGGEVVTPVAVPGLCSSRVLTMSWVEGEPLLRRGSAALPLDRCVVVAGEPDDLTRALVGVVEKSELRKLAAAAQLALRGDKAAESSDIFSQDPRDVMKPEPLRICGVK